MALTAPNLLATATPNTTNTITSPSFTPTANSLLLVVDTNIGGATSANTGYTATDSLGTPLTYTLIGEIGGGSTTAGIRAWWAQVGGSPVAMTVTSSTAGSPGHHRQFVYEVTGHDTSTPVVGAVTAFGTTSTTPQTPVGSTPTTNDQKHGWVVSRNINTAITLATSYTSIAEAHNATPSATTRGQYRASDTSTTFDPAAMSSAWNGEVAWVVQVAAGTAVNVSGVVANITTAAPAGTVSIAPVLTGPVGAITLAAPAGTVSAPKNMVGPVAAIALAAPAGTVSAPKNLVGPVANITLAAPAGTVTAGSSTPYTASGVVAAVALAAPAGTVSAPKNLVGPVSTLALAAPAGSVSAPMNLLGPVSTLVLAAPAGTVTAGSSTPVNVTTGPAPVLISAPAGSVSIVGFPTFYQFSPPLFTRDRAGTDRFWGQLTVTHSKSILKNGSFYTDVQGPSNEQIVAADVTYLGGHIYTVSATEALALIQAGYGAGLTTSTGLPAGLVLIDNGDGTFTASGLAVVDNGDGTFTLNSPTVADHGDGSLTVAA